MLVWLLVLLLLISAIYAFCCFTFFSNEREYVIQEEHYTFKI